MRSNLFESIGSFKVASDIPAANNVLETLKKNYPDHQWGVHWDEDGGICNIVCFTVMHPLKSNSLYGYTLHLKTIFGDPSMKKVMRAGGEILERATIDRGRYRNGDIPVFVEGVQKKHQPILDANGHPIIF